MAQEENRLQDPVSEADWPRGPSHAPVVLVEYGDYDCNACRAVHGVVERLLAEKGDHILFAFRHFPLTKPHPRALPAARAAEAAGRQGKFWEMHKAIFENPREPSDQQLAKYAAHIGLDMARFATDFADKEIEREILRRRMHGLRSGVNGTPTFYINGKRYDGEPSYESLAAAIDARL